jgi:hypothetical protein|uniref:Uncharacterized protein n=1 Tax=Siphoviridae sp. cthL03 TaxID=2825615 RepID=A0A8S5PGW5_9CAUD|nr:hypothetical protein [uncultured Lachnoclostridium sp.]DAE05617.1 MAG TPA: hypothetical protein [Siphoviridae sp. cthL03]
MDQFNLSKEVINVQGTVEFIRERLTHLENSNDLGFELSEPATNLIYLEITIEGRNLSTKIRFGEIYEHVIQNKLDNGVLDFDSVDRFILKKINELIINSR